MSLIRSMNSILSLGIKKSLGRVIYPVEQTRNIKRWVAPTLREFRRRAKLLGPEKPQPRSEFYEWNYRSELFAFGKRLNEEFDLNLLQTAFTQRAYVLREQQRQKELGIEDVDIEFAHNEKLASIGENLVKDYVQAYLKYSLPQCPIEGRRAFANYLVSEDTLVHVSTHLGTKELIFDVEYPPLKTSLAKSLLAVIGALAESSGVERAFHFIRDFICTQLNQKDLLDLWNIEDPEELLRTVCKERQLPEPEPRLIGCSAQNTVLAAYNVGMYVNKQLIGKGYGEDVTTAIKTAAIDALQALFDIQDNMRPFNFQLQIEPKSLDLKE